MKGIQCNIQTKLTSKLRLEIKKILQKPMYQDPFLKCISGNVKKNFDSITIHPIFPKIDLTLNLKTIC